jgi:hypothetical protein
LFVSEASLVNYCIPAPGIGSLSNVEFGGPNLDEMY